MSTKIIPKNESYLYTQSTALAAAMGAIGFLPKAERPLIRTFTKAKPKGTLGEFFWRLQTHSTALYVKDAYEVMAQWFKPRAEMEFEAAQLELGTLLDTAMRHMGADPAVSIEAIGKAQKVFLKLRELYPCALVAYCGQTERNRQKYTTHLMKAAETDKDCPYTRIDHEGDAYTLIQFGTPEAEIKQLLAAARR